VKFVVDFMCGRLARWMRILGYDTLYMRDTDRGKLIEVARKEGRIIITRDTHLPGTPGVKVFLLSSEFIREQLKEIRKNFPPAEMLTRCSLCNTPLEKVPKEKAKGNVPEYTYLTHDEFYYCPVCKKFYWEGTHCEFMREFLREVDSA